MKRLPIGFSKLEDMLNNNCLYVDKTKFIFKMVQASKCYFLSRPRRFGKSLLTDTIKQAFLGNKKIFTGLYLENNWDWDVVYPVIQFDFAIGEIESRQQLDIKINSMLNDIAKSYQVELNEILISDRFRELIQKLKYKYNQQVVILIDEYDKPMLDNIADIELCEHIRRGLRDLYSVIKGADGDIKFVFITGVSKFGQAGLFSGLNNLDDISLDSQYADVCGYTQANIENELSEYMKGGNVDLTKLKKWYNGYNFLGTEEQRVYNPFDVLLFCDKNYTYDCYWFKTGTPTFLIKLLEKNNYFIPELLENSLINAYEVDLFDIDNIPIEALLFQSGYLTIKEATTIGVNRAYSLTYPNLEVKSSLNIHLAQLGIEGNKSRSLNQLFTAFENNNFDELGNIFAAHFASIPHNWYERINHYEGFYASIVYSLLCGLGYDCIPEDISNIGRIDLAIKMPDKVFIIEFKLSNRGNATDAIQQIKDRQYADKYRILGLPIYMIGISFDQKSKNLSDYKWQMA